jgi:hypothetical protein
MGPIRVAGASGVPEFSSVLVFDKPSATKTMAAKQAADAVCFVPVTVKAG